MKMIINNYFMILYSEWGAQNHQIPFENSPQNLLAQLRQALHADTTGLQE